MSDINRVCLNSAPVFTRILLGLVGLMMLETNLYAQASNFGKTSAPTLGGTNIAPQPATSSRPMMGTYVPHPTTPDGKLCISVHASATPQKINPKIIDQAVLIENICGQAIKVKVCYAGKPDCIVVPLGGYQRVLRILGLGVGSADFKYEYRELF